MRAHGVVEAVSTLSCQAVTGRVVIRADVAVAGTHLTAGTWQCQVAIETRAASVTVWT